MKDIKQVIEEKKDQIEQLRDEIKLQAHLGEEKIQKQNWKNWKRNTNHFSQN